MSALAGRHTPTHHAAAAPEGLPRLLAGSRPDRALRLDEHETLHGELPGASRRHRRLGGHGEAELITVLEHAGLRGRGGAAFPTAKKMRAVAASRKRPIVLVNGAEGEPASMKDRTLLELLPHLVLDGAELAALALGSELAVIAVCETAPEAVAGVRAAITERTRRRRARGMPELRLVLVPGHFAAGQESALVNWCNGGPAMPGVVPPAPYERGVERRPTLVSNVETFAHIALIARYGGDWFRELGTGPHSGSMLVTISGALNHPGVYEIECGSTLASLVAAAGGLSARAQGVLLGGYGGTWLDADALSTVRMSNEELAAHEATVGSGVVWVLSDHSCPVAETARLARWLADQSTRQCGPCLHGLDAIATEIAALAGGTAGPEGMPRLAALAGLARGRGACAHPDGAVRQLLSAVRTFHADFELHASRGRCEFCNSTELPLPLRPVERRGGREIRREQAVTGHGARPRELYA